MRISDWSSDVCSSDLIPEGGRWLPMPPFMESEEFYFIYLFIAVQAFYLLGSVWFARFSFVKKTVLLVVLVVLGVYYIYYINARVFGFGSYKWSIKDDIIVLTSTRIGVIMF